MRLLVDEGPLNSPSTSPVLVRSMRPRSSSLRQAHEGGRGSLRVLIFGKGYIVCPVLVCLVSSDICDLEARTSVTSGRFQEPYHLTKISIFPDPS
eukprot:1175735-Prorocentrum_minimum.AAC.5